MAHIVLNTQDLTYLKWSKIRNTGVLGGSFLKSIEMAGDKKIYYKLSDYNSNKGITGHECINEIIVDRLLTLLGIDHLEYTLINANILVGNTEINTYLCASEDFKESGEEKLALDAYYDLEKLEKETPLEFCIRKGFDKYIYQMLVVDFLILNRDRHGANIEVLRNSKKKAIRLAPLFDHGLSLLCTARTNEDINKVDVLEDKRVQCFVGSFSAKNNLNLIPKDKLPTLNKLKEEDKNYLFKDLTTVISTELIDKIWEMIWRRWQYYEDFCAN